MFSGLKFFFFKLIKPFTLKERCVCVVLVLRVLRFFFQLFENKFAVIPVQDMTLCVCWQTKHGSSLVFPFWVVLGICVFG
jgi:hypothetical protein